MNKILIANRGEIARRVIRTCRQMGLASVAVFSDADRDALFVAEADEAVPLGGLKPADSYLRIDAVLEAAQRSGADAIHPGYGFLSENAIFAAKCIAAGLTFIGPTPEAISAMGSKIEAKRRMQAAGVPVLGSIDAGSRKAAELSTEAAKLGWPALIKASAGGGGRGMRIVRRREDLADALEAARREAGSAFGDDSVFIEPYIDSARHVEVQIFGDMHGQVVHLFERECSIQRRHQKIVEEAPSTAVDDELRAAMGKVAVTVGKTIGYVGAGTVEFLLTPEGRFHFLEVNTRLQVEHPVTECITGLDLVRLQILVAQGLPLPDEALSPQIRGHAIEVRLYAEDPRHDYRPSIGQLHRFQLPGEGLRIDSGVTDGDEVSPYYDSMLAKVIAHAPTREEAAQRLAAAMARAQIHGITTNRDLLVRVLRHPEFLSGQTDTHFLVRHNPAELAAPLADTAAERLHAAAAALASQARRRSAACVQATIPSGWRNNLSQLQQVRYTGESGEIEVGYRLGRDGVKVRVNGEDLNEPRATACTPSLVRLQVDGVDRRFHVHQVGNDCFVDSPLGSSHLRELDRYPLPAAETAVGSLMAPLPGVVDQVKVRPGDSVAAGDVLLVIESMKMLHPVVAPVAGRVAEICVAAAAHVAAGTVLAVIDEQSAGVGDGKPS